jgi:hypothetical protein
MVLLKGPTGWRFLTSEVALYANPRAWSRLLTHSGDTTPCTCRMTGVTLQSHVCISSARAEPFRQTHGERGGRDDSGVGIWASRAPKGGRV